MSESTYTVEELPVKDLLVDPRVQRETLKLKKVAEIEKKFNPDAVGVIHVSRRKDRGLYIIDGWHRNEVLKRKGIGTVKSHVFEGLTLVEEALMFLDLNYSEKVTLMDKFKAMVSAEDPGALRIQEIVGSRGWKISPVPANGNINAVGTLLRIHELSEQINPSQHLLDAVLLVITRAWGIDRYASQAVVLEGLARVIAEYGQRLRVDVLIEKLKARPGGPAALHANAVHLASMRRGRTTMAIAELVVEEYNKNRKASALPRWGKRS